MGQFISSGEVVRGVKAVLGLSRNPEVVVSPLQLSLQVLENGFLLRAGVVLPLFGGILLELVKLGLVLLSGSCGGRNRHLTGGRGLLQHTDLRVIVSIPYDMHHRVQWRKLSGVKALRVAWALNFQAAFVSLIVGVRAQLDVVLLFKGAV